MNTHAMREKRLEEMLVAHKLWLESEGSEGKRADMRGISLTGGSAHFRRADLRRADFSYASFMLVDFRCARLEGANFQGSTFLDVDFRGSNLMGADFRGAKFTQADFRLAESAGVNFQDAELYLIHCGKTDFSNADFRNANTTGINFSRTNIEGALIDATHEKKAQTMQKSLIRELHTKSLVTDGHILRWTLLISSLVMLTVVSMQYLME